MKLYTKYNVESGRIISFGLCQDEIFESSTNIIEGQYSDVDYYILNGIPTERPIFIPDKTEILANNVDTVTVSGLPNPFIVTIDGIEYTITDGVFEFVTSLAGIYKIIPQTFPYKQIEVDITAS